MFDKTWLADTGERALRAFLEGFLAVLLTVHLFDIDTNVLEIAVAGGFAAAGAILLSALAALNNKSGASFVVEAVPLPPTPVDPPDEEVAL